MGGTLIPITLEAVTDGKLHSIYIVTKAKDPKEANMAALQSIQFNSK